MSHRSLGLRSDFAPPPGPSWPCMNAVTRTRWRPSRMSNFDRRARALTCPFGRGRLEGARKTRNPVLALARSRDLASAALPLGRARRKTSLLRFSPARAQRPERRFECRAPGLPAAAVASVVYSRPVMIPCAKNLACPGDSPPTKRVRPPPSTRT